MRRFKLEPKIKYRTCIPMYPPPGFGLKVPEWEPEYFLLRIGGGCSEYADKFEKIEQMFKMNGK